VDPSDVVLVLAVLLVVVDFVIRVVALVVIPRNRKPQTAMAWLLAIFFLPYIGILLFLLLGSRHLPKRRRDKQQAINRYILETTEGTDLLNHEDPWPPWLEPIAELNRTLGAMPLVGGNTATLLTD
jgi:cardiolipin synthase